MILSPHASLISPRTHTQLHDKTHSSRRCFALFNLHIFVSSSVSSSLYYLLNKRRRMLPADDTADDGQPIYLVCELPYERCSTPIIIIILFYSSVPHNCLSVFAQVSDRRPFTWCGFLADNDDPRRPISKAKSKFATCCHFIYLPLHQL